MPASAKKQTHDEGAPAATLAIQNDAHHIKCFWYREIEGGKYTANKATSANEMFRLLPGLNATVPRKVWDAMMEVSMWRKWRDDGDVSVMDKPPTKLPPRQALALIEHSACIASMQRWRRSETRAQVRVALDKKILDMKRLAVPERHTGQAPSFDDE